MPVTFITGPVRSGKSRFAERLARERGEPVTYVATALRDPGDAEWIARIERHRETRPAAWPTIETSALDARAIAALLATFEAKRTVLVDSLGTWLAAEMSRRLDGRGELAAIDVDGLEADGRIVVDALLRCRAHAIVVGEEAGWGLVPQSAAGRAFRDVLGRLQQRLAAGSDAAYLVVSGFALDLRERGTRVDDGANVRPS